MTSFAELPRDFFSNLPRDPNVKEVQFSRGWVVGFKKRHGIYGFTRHGEAPSIDVSIDTQILIGKIKDKVATFDPTDVFNINEIGLFFRFV